MLDGEVHLLWSKNLQFRVGGGALEGNCLHEMHFAVYQSKPQYTILLVQRDGVARSDYTKELNSDFAACGTKLRKQFAIIF